ncbi:transcription termination/antitermination NusG family protein [Robertmurraya massiliosenegalensis]|uniref:transcription termination/antitermination NusG family protein n=1 Tax=Robertmurraya massiliosenegalensis TaxID=1287657 RepID=UPI0002FA827D|nr:transcription termination/antitermination NusG family protein [Robertmurraya massiliosenegalensis]
MPYFAIHVKTGCERIVAKHISIICKKQNRDEIENVIVPTKTIIDMTTKSKVKQSVKAKLDSYIFVSVKKESLANYHELSGTVFHFLKNASPHIRKILPHSLLQQEYEAFLETSNISEVEVIVPKPQENTTQNPSIKLYKEKFIKNRFMKQKISFTRYIQEIFRAKGKKISIQLDEKTLTISSNSKTLMDIFSDSDKSIHDLMFKPIRTLLEIAGSYDRKTVNTC